MLMILCYLSECCYYLQVLFLAFVMTVPIVLINMVVGLAIYEIRTMQAKAELLSLKRTIQSIPNMPKYLLEKTNMFRKLSQILNTKGDTEHLLLCVKPIGTRRKNSHHLYFWNNQSNKPGKDTGLKVPDKVVKSTLKRLQVRSL